MTDAPVPDVPGALTGEWLTTTLRASGALDPGAAVSGITVEPIVDFAGVNGEALRLRMQYEGLEARAPDAPPASLIAKLPSRIEAARGVAAFQRWYEREVRFYAELASTSPIRTPRCHYGALDPGGGYLLLLEDLAPMSQGDQIAGCDAVRASAVVRAVARLHARWWQHPSLAAHDWLPLTTVGVDRALAIQGAVDRAWRYAGRSTPAGDLLDGRLVERFIEAYPDLLEAFAQPPLTVIHGDYRLDNLFLDADPEGDGGVAVIDWQFTARCRGAYDVAYFLGLDLPIEERRTHEDDLLRQYHAELETEGVRDYDLDHLRRDYHIGLLLTLATFLIGAAGTHGGRMQRVHEVGLERLAIAINDLGVEDLLA